jgi:hypothetical protein
MDQALALIDIAAGRDGFGLAEERVGQALLRVRDSGRQAKEQSREAEDEASSCGPLRHKRGSLHDNHPLW